MMEVNSWLTGRRGVSLPFTDELEPLCDDPGLFGALLGEAQAQARSRRWKYCELRGGRSLLNEVPPSLSFHGHQLKLQPDSAKLFAKCSGAARTAVRKAEQAGLTIEFSQSLAAMQTFHQLLCKTRVKHGAPPQPFRFFENIHREIMEMKRGWIVLAKLGAQTAGAAVFFHFNNLVLYKFAASDAALRHVQANNLVLWRAIEHYAKAGCSMMDLGRTSESNSGLRRFKLAWGAEERRIDYVRYQPRGNRFVTSVDQASGWQRIVFRFLPVAVSRALGSLIYGHFA